MKKMENKQTEIFPTPNQAAEGGDPIPWNYADLAIMCINNTPPKQGETIGQMRLAIKTLDKLHASRSEIGKEIELEDTEFDFLSECVNGLPRWPFRHVHVVEFREHIETMGGSSE